MRQATRLTPFLSSRCSDEGKLVFPPRTVCSEDTLGRTAGGSRYRTKWVTRGSWKHERNVARGMEGKESTGYPQPFFDNPSSPFRPVACGDRN